MQASLHNRFPDDAPSSLQLAIDCWSAGVVAVQGELATRKALDEDGTSTWRYVLALGKAASSMMCGALECLAPDGSALLLTKYDHLDRRLVDDPRIRCLTSAHPVPDQNSLDAGQSAIDFVDSLPADAGLLVLVSGGASALVEALQPGMTLDDLVELTDALLAEGYSIDQINAIRVDISRVKGGKLLRRFGGRTIQVYALSDIPGDDIDLIGSGIGGITAPRVRQFPLTKRVESIIGPRSKSAADTVLPEFVFSARLVATNAVARKAAAAHAKAVGLTVVESEPLLDGDIEQLATTLGERLQDTSPGVYVWGGEPTVTLPDSPGKGGRNQSLAVALGLACSRLKMSGISGVVGGTDGTDGPTEAAGGVFYTGADLSGAQSALQGANAEPWLRDANALLHTGPTGTNVMDLAVVIVESTS